MAENTYNSAIPASERLQDAKAAALCDDAPAIAANTPRRLEDVTACLREVKRRKFAQSIQPPPILSVQSDEIAQSVVRLTAVAMENATGQYGAGVGAPAWAQQLNERLQDIDERLQDNNERLQDNNERLQDMETRQKETNARLRNIEARQANKKAEAADHPLTALCKVNPGYGPPVMDRNHRAIQLDLNPSEPVIGTPYPDFPQTRSDAFRMTINQIAHFSVWYNESLGIVANDDVGTRRSKLLQFIVSN